MKVNEVQMDALPYIFSCSYFQKGILGDPGEGLTEYFRDGSADPLLYSLRRVTGQLRRVLRQRLHLSGLWHSLYVPICQDRVLWMGFGVGGAASILLPYYFDDQLNTTTMTDKESQKDEGLRQRVSLEG